MKLASLSGLPTSPEPRSQVTVFWDTASKDVFLLVNNLPQPASDKQYQLWALLNGKPVDLGVFDIRQEKLMVKMKGVEKAQAFAITLEPRGGSAVPTMPNMYVYGKL
jgi:anti-sigma-K factor RskA